MRLATLLAVTCVLGILASRPAIATKPARATAAIGADNYPSPADRFVEKALEAEAAGDLKSRDDHLQKALKSDPNHPAAHWHRSELLVNGKWLSVDDAAKQMAAGGKIFEYNNRRNTTGGAPAEQLALAQWCASTGLPEQQRFHALQAIAVDPSLVEARALLGVRPDSGLWLTANEMAERTRQAERDRKSLEQWNKQLSGWLRDIQKSAREQTRQVAREQVRGLADPTAIPALEQIFSIESEPVALLAVEAVSNMPQQTATNSLIRYAVLSPWEEVRQAAAVKLKDRSLYSYAPLLLSGLQSPIEAQFAFTEEAPGSWRYRCTLFREGPMADAAMDLQVSVRPSFSPQTGSGQDLVDARMGTSLPGQQEGLNAAQSISDRAFGVNAAGVEEANQRTVALNERIINVLKVTTDAGEKPPQATQSAEPAKPAKDAAKSKSKKAKKSKRAQGDAEPVKESTSLAAADDRQPRYWWKWWYDHNDIYYTDSRPTDNTYRQYQATYQPVIRTPDRSQPSSNGPYTLQGPLVPAKAVNYVECFVAGTPVYTPTGRMGIELVQPGDLVLAQHPETGELAYKAVLATTARPPAQLLHIQLEQGELIVTRGHPLWVSGKGWRMARELSVGDRLHTADGSVPIQQIEVAPKAVAYNLVVDGFNTFFAGPDRVLAHDNDLRQPTDTVVPGLAAKR